VKYVSPFPLRQTPPHSATSRYYKRKMSILVTLEDMVEAWTMEVEEYIDITYVNARKAFSRDYYQRFLKTIP
jgi:hypothetical protein